MSLRLTFTHHITKNVCNIPGHRNKGYPAHHLTTIRLSYELFPIKPAGKINAWGVHRLTCVLDDWITLNVPWAIESSSLHSQWFPMASDGCHWRSWWTVACNAEQRLPSSVDRRLSDITGQCYTSRQQRPYQNTIDIRLRSAGWPNMYTFF